MSDHCKKIQYWHHFSHYFKKIICQPIIILLVISPNILFYLTDIPKWWLKNERKYLVKAGTCKYIFIFSLFHFRSPTSCSLSSEVVLTLCVVGVINSPTTLSQLIQLTLCSVSLLTKLWPWVIMSLLYQDFRYNKYTLTSSGSIMHQQAHTYTASLLMNAQLVS